jgi:hypothetical protein
MMIGKVYKIIHSQSDIVYIGSTFNKLNIRWASHKSQKNSKCVIGKYIKEFGSDQFKIILIKEYEVVDKTHLFAYEQLWINKTKCINTQSSFRITKLYMKEYRVEYGKKNRELLNEKAKQYREKNRELLNEKAKQYHSLNKIDKNKKNMEYYEKNKAQIAERLKEKIQCSICNGIFRKADINRHNKSKKHVLHC